MAIYNFEEVIKSNIQSSIDTKFQILRSQILLEEITKLSNDCISVLTNEGKILFAGNGGSFADSQHLAAEFISRLQFDRSPLPSIALGTNSSSTTAIGNDYGYEQIFARELMVMGNEKDIFIPITTSGNSPSIIAATKIALSKDMKVLGLTGETGGKLADLCPCIKVPSTRTERIQECHIMIGHIVCGLVEHEIFVGRTL
jgi:D-sedoheptulose 7-phosphate isomerase